MTMTTRLRARAQRWWDEFFLAVFVGIPVGIVTSLSHVLTDNGGIPRSVLADSTRGTLFGALVGLAALLLSVMLAVLAILTSMEERPIVQRFKASGSNMFKRLVYALLGPVFVSLALAALAVLCIGLSSGAENATAPANPSAFAVTIVSITLGLTATSLAQGAYVASLIARMLVFEGRPPLLTPEDEPPRVSRAAATISPLETDRPGTVAVAERDLSPASA